MLKYLLILLLPTCILAQNVNPDDVDRVFDDTNANNLKRDMLNSDTWFKKGSDYAKLFQRQDSRLIYKWLGTPISQFEVTEDSNPSISDLIVGERTFKKGNGDELILTIIIPHPSKIAMAQADLVPELNKLAPPKLEVLSTKQTNLQGQPVEMYNHADQKTCSTLFRLPKNSALELRYKCELHDQVVEFSNLLSISNTARRLAN